MSEAEERKEIYERLRVIESDTSWIKAMLQERCDTRQRCLDDIDARLRKIEAAEQRRKGGLALLAGLMTVASVAGAALMKLVER